MNKKVLKTLIYIAIIAPLMNIHHPLIAKIIFDYQFDGAFYGYTLSFMALGSMLSAKYWGKLWDKYYSRFIIILPFAFFYSFAQFGLSLSETKSSILFFRFLSGPFASGIMYTIPASLIASQSNRENITKNQVVLVAVMAIFSPIGYFIGGVLGDLFSPINAIKIQALLVFLSFFLGLFLVENGQKIILEKTSENVCQNKKNCSCKTNFKKIGYPLFLILLPFFLIQLNAGKYFDLTLISENFSTTSLGTIVMIIGILSAIFLLTIGRFISTKLDEINLFQILFPLIAIFLITSGWFRNVNLLIFFATSSYLLIPLVQSLLNSLLSKRFACISGEALGIRRTFDDFGTIIGPIFIGYIFIINKWLTFSFLGFLLLITSFILFFNKSLYKNLKAKHVFNKS